MNCGMNIAGVVILYHPDIKQLSENINTYVPGLKELYIYDNSEIQTPGIEAALNNLHPCIKYQFFNSNEGIAKRLNQAVETAMQSQYDYLLTMDQDSSFKVGDFDTTLTVRVNNLLDTDYIADAIDASDPLVYFGFGRTFSLSAKIKF